MVCLNSKVYIAHANATADRRRLLLSAPARGLQHHINPLEVADMRKVLQTRQSLSGTNRGFPGESRGGHMQYSQQRAALTYLYCKRIVHDDGVTTSPLKLKN